MQPVVDVAGSGAPSSEPGVRRQVLLCRAGGKLVAVPISTVVETMRPLPVRSLPGLPPYVLGVAIIRGAPLPVVDLAALLGRDGGEDGGEHLDGVGTVGRFVRLDVAGRGLALAVGSVLGVRDLDAGTGDDLPPLLGALDRDVIASIGTVDPELLLVLRAGWLVPDEAWAAVGAAPEGAQHDAQLEIGRLT